MFQSSQDIDALQIMSDVMSASRSFAYRCNNDEAVTMTYLSGCVAEITGCRPQQLLNNRDLSFASLCHPDDLRPMIDHVDAQIEKRAPWDIDYRLIRPDQTEILVRERGAAVFSEAGEVEFLQGLVIDASAENRLRKQLQKNISDTEAINKDILSLAQSIAGSVRELTMLSVNARIEAAWVGDAGRGFAVVASEINSLAERNAEWADEITERMLASERSGIATVF